MKSISSKKALGLAFDPRLSLMQMRVLFAIISLADKKTGITDATHQQMVDELGMYNTKNISHAVKALIGFKLVEVTYTGRSNIYRVLAAVS